MNHQFTGEFEFETAELLNDTFEKSQKAILYDAPDKLEAMIEDMEDGENQADEVWQTFERVLRNHGQLALDRKEFCLSNEHCGPLMQLFRQKPPVRVAELIFDNWPEDVQVSKVKDANDRTILFHEIQGGALMKVIESIVEKDCDVIKANTASRRYPVAEELRSRMLRKTTHYLMKKGRCKNYGISPLVATIRNRNISDRVIE